MSFYSFPKGYLSNKTKGNISTSSTPVVVQIINRSPPEITTSAVVAPKLNDEPTFMCVLCVKNFAAKKSLLRHLRAYHPDEAKAKRVRMPRKCPGCDTKLSNMLMLCSHVSEAHAVELKNQALQFPSHEDFAAWLEQEEVRSSSKFYKDGKNLFCHRSGVYKPKPKEQRKRQLKAYGSVRIGATCPAHIRVEKTDGVVNVDYQSTHYGHHLEPGTLPLTRAEKNVIAAKLAQGLSYERILREAHSQDLTTNNDDSSDLFRVKKRSQLLNRADLINIARQYRIDRKNMDIQQAEETTNVDKWVRNEVAKKNGTVLYYKSQGNHDDSYGLDVDDFVLVLQTPEQKEMLQLFGHDKICVHFSHCSPSTGCEIVIITLLVVDNFESGFPVAHCLSTVSKEDIITTFFAIIFNCCGAVKCGVFLSEDVGFIREAWWSTMGRPPQNMNSEQIKKLRVNLLRGLSKKLCGLKKISQSGGPEELRTTNLTVKKELNLLTDLEGVGICKCLDILLDVIETSVRERKIQLSRNRNSKKSVKIAKTHKCSLELSAVLGADNCWSVGPESVSLKNNHICDNNCAPICAECGGCYDTVFCTCDEYASGVICIHAHAAMATMERTTNLSRAPISDKVSIENKSLALLCQSLATAITDCKPDDDMLDRATAHVKEALSIVDSSFFAGEKKQAEAFKLIRVKNEGFGKRKRIEKAVKEKQIKIATLKDVTAEPGNHVLIDHSYL